MPLKAGDLDRRVTIERATSLEDQSSGQPIETWEAVATVSASRRDVSDSERIAAAEVEANITTRFQIRWSATVSNVGPRDRLVCEGRAYGIVAVKELGRREGLEITASARADG